ncbi:hypothetical protein GQ54DRAFT_316297 [Martensiomyces pterosporus]|nr:hypothetical protein GQ54DRAFT_316297 [Martensiomyces pterosporus]
MNAAAQDTPPTPTTRLPSGRRELPLLDAPRESVIDFGGFPLEYHVPMMYPTEANLYEQTISAGNSVSLPTVGQTSIKAEVELNAPCGHFNIWRPLHDRSTPISQRLARFFPDSDPAAARGALAKSTSQPANPSDRAPRQAGAHGVEADEWDSRISYSSADDEYYQNGRALPFIRGWEHGVLARRSVFRKVEHDWRMSYLAPMHRGLQTQTQPQPLLTWRFNYAASKRAVERVHAVLGFSLFAETAAIQWYIRPLSKPGFTLIPIHLLSAAEARNFPEIPGNKVAFDDDTVLDSRRRTIERYKGKVLAYQESANEFNAYIVHSVPYLHADLTEYVRGEYGFEIAVGFFPAAEGENIWQKVQIARQSINERVAGHTKEGEDVMRHCGLDFRIKLRDDIEVGAVTPELKSALVGSEHGGSASMLRMDDRTCDFVIRVNDPENIVGSLQPPVRAHERVLAAGSEYFAALLSSTMTESEEKQVVLEDMPYGAVRLAINYIYTGGIPVEESMRIDDWVLLLDVASRLSIPRLAQLCQARIFREALVYPYLQASQGFGANAANGNEQGGLSGGADYRELVEYPDMEFIHYLEDIAARTGAHELLEALQRLVTYYPIGVCEDRIRGMDPSQFRRPLERPVDDWHDFMHRHLHGPGLPFPDGGEVHVLDDGLFAQLHDGLFPPADDDLPMAWLPEGHRRPLNIDEFALMPGPVVHPGFVPAHNDNGHWHANREQAQNQPAGFAGQFFGLLGNWRRVNVDNGHNHNHNHNHNNHHRHVNQDQDPPEPQPGPVPEPPHRTAASRSDSPPPPEPSHTHPPP